MNLTPSLVRLMLDLFDKSYKGKYSLLSNMLNLLWLNTSKQFKLKRAIIYEVSLDWRGDNKCLLTLFPPLTVTSRSFLNLRIISFQDTPLKINKQCLLLKSKLKLGLLIICVILL